MVKPTLLVLAAGMGSRYGSLKQMDGVGPHDEAIIDYSIYDAIRAGFGKVVFVIRHSFEKEFREIFTAERFGGRIAVEFVFQELEYLPEGCAVPEGRVKPWGTNHAVLMAKEAIREPFAVINADDFYGRDGFRVLAEWLSRAEGENRYCMVGYRVGNTLSESGTVSRGVCRTDAEGYLTGVTERTDIARVNGEITFTGDDGRPETTSETTPVSMNMWGFTPDYFRYSEELFKTFLAENIDRPKAEFYIPFVVNELIVSGKATVEVLDTTARWFGVTYAEDRQGVVDKIRALVDAGEYPEKLWQ